MNLKENRIGNTSILAGEIFHGMTWPETKMNLPI
jgi:hypothetical protein